VGEPRHESDDVGPAQRGNEKARIVHNHISATAKGELHSQKPHRISPVVQRCFMSLSSYLLWARYLERFEATCPPTPLEFASAPWHP
jgi:hypothetical protein